MSVPDWHLILLGPPQMLGPSGQSVAVDRKSLALLAYLALEGPTPRSRLAGLLWPDTVEATARNNLVHKMRRLRARVGTDLVEAEERLRLAEHLHVDARAVLQDRQQGRTATLLEAQGTLLADAEFDDLPDLHDWLLVWRERFGAYRWEALQDQLAQLEAREDYGQAAALAARLLELDPLSEETARRDMRLRYLAGDPAGALRSYARLRRALDRELGVEPLTQTRSLAEEIERGGRLPATTAVLSQAPPLALLRPPDLIGREYAWTRMAAAWQAGQLIYLTGPPGAGKTRLALDFARAQGTTLHLEHRPGDETVPYASSARWTREMLRHAPRLQLTPFQRRELARILPEFREAEPAPWRAETDKLALYEALSQVADLALAGVTAVVSDNVQYDDDASQESGRYYAARAAGARAAAQPRVLLTFRQGELSPQAHAVMTGLIDAGLAVLIELEPLGVADVRALLEGFGLPFAPDLDEQLFRYAGGNPLFVLETVRFLVAEGLLTQGLPDRLAPPGRTGSVLERRLSRLSPGALNAARAAGVLHSDFTLELVSEVLGAPLLDTARVWEELEAAQIVTGERFGHDLQYEAVLRSTPTTVRQLLHRSAARVLAKHGDQPWRVAQHWWDGGNAFEAAGWYIRAAQAAEAALRPLEAERFYQQAREAQAGTAEAPGRSPAVPANLLASGLEK